MFNGSYRFLLRRLCVQTQTPPLDHKSAENVMT